MTFILYADARNPVCTSWKFMYMQRASFVANAIVKLLAVNTCFKINARMTELHYIY